MNGSRDGLKPMRGKTIMMRVKPTWSAEETLKEALRKHMAHNSHVISDNDCYTLCYKLKVARRLFTSLKLPPCSIYYTGVERTDRGGLPEAESVPVQGK